MTSQRNISCSVPSLFALNCLNCKNIIYSVLSVGDVKNKTDSLSNPTSNTSRCYCARNTSSNYGYFTLLLCITLLLWLTMFLTSPTDRTLYITFSWWVFTSLIPMSMISFHNWMDNRNISDKKMSVCVPS